MSKINQGENADGVVSLTFFDKAIANAVAKLESDNVKIFNANDVSAIIYGKDSDPLKPVETERINSSIDKLRSAVVTNGGIYTPILSCDRVMVNGSEVFYAFVTARATTSAGAIWKGFNAEVLAAILDDLHGAGAFDDDMLDEWREIYSSSHRAHEARTDRGRVALAKNHVLKAIDELEDLDACARVSGIVGILENAEDALSDVIRERG